MPFDSNKISNILGSKIPQWLINQLGTRASQGAKDVRDNDNILFIANKTAWIRLVSSVDIINPSDVEYFRRVVGDSIKNKEDLAKQFVLFGGTSKYLRENSYQQRSGLGKDGAYGILGNDEIQQFGYRPMPGINSVSIDTQGKLGSLRSATISFKCWDKAQLDIIDALYFKLGFTMFLEWGQTFFYPQGSDRIQSSELYSIDPFRKNLTKEEIAIQISRNIRQSEGNYDALLGMVTNFNFTYNQDGGYDCTLKLMALGILGDAIKINNPKDLPNILSEEIRQYNNTLVQIAQAEEKERQRLAEEEARKKKEQEEASQESLLKYLNKEINKVDAEPNAQQQLKIVEKAGIANSEAVSATNFDYFYDVKNRSWSLIVPRLGALIPRENTTDLVESINIDTTKLFNKLQVYFDSFNRFSTTRIPAVNVNATNPLSIESLAQRSQNLPLEVRMFRASVQSESTRDTRRRITFSYSGANGKKYPVGIKVEFDNVNPQFSRDSINAEEVYTKAINQIKQDGNFTVSNLTLGIATLKYPDIGEIDSTVNNITDSVDKISRFPIISLTKDLVVSVNDKVEVSRQTTTGTVTTESVGNVDVTVKVSLFITDTALIQSIVKGANSPDYKVVQAAIASQNQGSTTEQQAEGQDAANTQIEQSLQLQSGLELTLRTIQVHALNRAINKTKTPDLEIGRKVYTLPIWDKKDETQGGTPFYTQIFSNGIFSDYITDLIEKTVSIVDPKNPKERLILQSKYGFATELMAGRATQQELKGKEVDFQTLLNAYVVPYQINQEIVKGVSTNHPVYIPLGLLLMILNHSCTIYDTKDKASQTPLVYIDFNPNVNFFLTNTKHLSTNPFKVLIPFEGGFSDYQELFSKEILSANQTSILPLSGSTSNTPLFNTFKQDVLSSQIPSIKFGESNDGIYRGRMMNILLNIDYIIQLVRDYSLKDGTNSIYLKTFLEQIILDINKYLGNFSVLRLAYNDGGNTFHIVDDQVVPTLPEEEMLEPDNTDEIPLVGKYSIAKSLEIRTDVSSKLSSMIAISANADVQGKSTLSTNGDSFGFINTSYKDRFIPTKGDITGSVTSDQDTVKAAAIQFNQTISDFYSKINPSEANVSQATNYYIEKMSKVKNNEYPTRASSMIPVSVNFTTDGISGFTMGQAFTISDQLLPYTYNNRIVRNQKGLSQDHVNKVGFVVVGLTNTIENNQWTTAVRANMIFLKYKSDFVGSIKRPANTSLQFGVNPTQAYSNYINPANVTIPSGEARKNLVDAINKTNATTGVKILALAQATLEGYYPNTKAYRNNNPGNLRSVQGPFQQFATLEEGAQALVNYINRAISKQNKNYTNANTLVQYINVYAPASDNNDPNGYVASVLGYFRKVGVNNFNSNSLLSEISNFNNNVNLV